MRFLFVTCFLFFLGNGFPQSEELETIGLNTAILALDWGNDEIPDFTWKIKLKNGSWYAISSKNHQTNNQPIAIFGSLRDKKFLLDKCNLDRTNEIGEESVTCEFSCDSINVRQIFSKNESPYHFDVQLSIINESSREFILENDDSLSLSIGPGSGMISKDKIISDYIKPVTSFDGEVYPDFLVQSSSGEKEEQLDWIGFHNRYFALLLIPKESSNDRKKSLFKHGTIKYSTAIENEGTLPNLSFEIPIVSLKSKDSISWEFTVFVGPKSYNILKEQGVLDYSSILFSEHWFWMRWLCLGLYQLLLAIFFFIPNWGWSIIILALVVRILLAPLSKKTHKSQQEFIEAQNKMRPELILIKEKYKGGEQSERILKLYKKYNVSPFAGLKPLLVVLIQLPILIGLYHLLGTLFELRDASFLWINTLAEPDKLFPFGFDIPVLGEYFNLLPFLMAAVSLVAFKFSPAPVSDEKEQNTQNLFLILMTLIFFVLFYSFPAGMVLYWTFANIFQVLHQKILTSRINN